LLLILERKVLDLARPEMDELTSGLNWEERPLRSFGHVTARVVTVFQMGRGLDAHGVVDDATADALNAELVLLCAFGQQPAPDAPVITRALAGPCGSAWRLCGGPHPSPLQP
jgi:hypothetical protein